MAEVIEMPQWAPRVWRTKGGKLFALFGHDAVAFDATDNGLSKLLKMIPYIEDQPGYISGRQNIADHILKKPIKMSKQTERKRRAQNMDPKRKSLIHDLARKYGVKEDK
jgi:hypothetical protein